MSERPNRTWTPFAALLGVALIVAGCGSGAKGPSVAANPPEPTEPAPPSDECTTEFESTFAAIQKVIFEDRGCTTAVCHGAAAQGGLDLRAEVAYQNLFEVESQGSSFLRLLPGEPTESFLFLKLLAATEPGSVEIAGAPMPSGLPPLSREHIKALRHWIEAGAPKSGSIGDSVLGTSEYIEDLLGVCLPPATPIEIEPLAAPDREVGIQFEMPPFRLPAATEVEVCFAQYYDFSDVIPERFQDREAGVFYANGSRLRQDPHSHHLLVDHSGLGADSVDDEAFGEWRCRNGTRKGELCDPLDRDACGEGLCASELRDAVACIGFGPPGVAVNPTGGSIGGAQTAQQYNPPRDGQFERLPIKGIIFWNPHSYNLTGEDHEMHAWQNFFFTDDLRFEEIDIVQTGAIYIQSGQAPFTQQNYCARHVMPQGADLLQLSSHTHKRGRNFAVYLADGTAIYESFLYSDPVDQEYEAPLSFDSPDPDDRTLTYCADFKNGVSEDGSPDLRFVTRLSTMPARTSCKPVACAEGRIGAPCAGEGDAAACDSSPGAGDGWCDACAITAGVTTENEMFVLTGTYTMRD